MQRIMSEEAIKGTVMTTLLKKIPNRFNDLITLIDDDIKKLLPLLNGFKKTKITKILIIYIEYLGTKYNRWITRKYLMNLFKVDNNDMFKLKNWMITQSLVPNVTDNKSKIETAIYIINQLGREEKISIRTQELAIENIQNILSRCPRILNSRGDCALLLVFGSLYISSNLTIAQISKMLKPYDISKTNIYQMLKRGSTRCLEIDSDPRYAYE